MVSLDKALASQCDANNPVTIVGGERLPKGKNTVENVGRVISAARALEKAAAADREAAILRESELKDLLLQKEELINDLREQLASKTYQLDAYKRKEAADRVGLSISQRKALGIEDHSDSEMESVA